MVVTCTQIIMASMINSYLGASCVSNTARSACSANWICRLLAERPVLRRTSSLPTSARSKPSEASSSWQPGMCHRRTLTGTRDEEEHSDGSADDWDWDCKQSKS